MVLRRQKLPFFATEEADRLKEPIVEEKKYEMRVLFYEVSEPGKWISDNNSEFLLLLTSNNFSVNKLEKGPITYNILKNFDIFVIGSNRTGNMEISAGEFRAISQFVTDGRGLLFVGNEFIEIDNRYNDYLLQVFGMCFKSQIIDEKNNAYVTGGWKETPLINIFIEHPITEGVSEIFAQHNASVAIDLKKPAEPLAFSSPEANPPCVPILGIKEHGKGKIAFLGTEGIFTDDKIAGISKKDNSKLILNLFKWFPTWVECPNCGLMNPPGEKYCSRCRAMLYK
ncbi:MAG: hypothetical protein ACTSRP_02975 [Candidatus Helarchaeota archaeon]